MQKKKKKSKILMLFIFQIKYFQLYKVGNCTENKVSIFLYIISPITIIITVFTIKIFEYTFAIIINKHLHT